MSIRDSLQRLCSQYSNSSKEEFKGHPLAQFLRSDFPAELQGKLHRWQGIVVDGSPGKGNWSKVPWVAFFDETITSSARSGYYPVYLLSVDQERLYLSLNQGITVLRDEVGDRCAKEVLRSRAEIVRQRISEKRVARFGRKEIQLGSLGNGSLYEAGHIVGVEYSTRSLPDEETLWGDIEQMLSLYRDAERLGGTDDLTVVNADTDDSSERALVERRLMRLHKKRERNGTLPKRVKEIHGFDCQACGFSFKQTYGIEYVEAHHVIPLANFDSTEELRLDPNRDFRVLCANCHRAIHRQDDPSDFDGFVRRLES